MSSNNAQNIYDIQSNTRFVKTNAYSDATSLIRAMFEDSSTYCGNEYHYPEYILEGAERLAIENRSNRNEGDDMKSDDMLRAYMDKVDKDQRELKSEMRERENRISLNIRESEQRMDARLDRIEKMICEQNENYDKKIETLSNKLDDSVVAIQSNKRQIIALIIATIISVAGVAIAAIQVVQGFISLVQ